MAQPSSPPASVPLSVVIATRDRAAMLDECLTRLEATTPRPAEIVVIDTGSATDETARVAAAHAASFLRADLPGVCYARNVGWRMAANECIAFIDDDVLVYPTWAGAMATAFAEDAVDFVTGWIGVPAGQEDAQDPQPLMVEPDPRRLDRSTNKHMGASANMGARRTALARVGGFDERLGPATWFAASEDHDLFDRLVLAGCVGMYRPDVGVDHEAWRNRRARLRQHWRYGKGTGGRLRLLMHRDRARAAHEARELLWRHAAVEALVRARQRWEVGAACSFLRLTGGLLGFAVALVTLRKPWPVS
jgi:glycosyltransferase involved in cell wall biosynthesis